MAMQVSATSRMNAPLLRKPPTQLCSYVALRASSPKDMQRAAISMPFPYFITRSSHAALFYARRVFLITTQEQSPQSTLQLRRMPSISLESGFARLKRFISSPSPLQTLSLPQILAPTIPKPEYTALYFSARIASIPSIPFLSFVVRPKIVWIMTKSCDWKHLFLFLYL